MEKIRKCKTLATALQEDRISGLPNEVVLMILSHLTMKEAVRTSILSRSWKDLWKAYSGCLDFDAPNLIWLTECHTEFHHQAACRYTVWVDNVLDSHQCQTIQGLRIAFDMNKRFSGPIDRWIDFAISKKVGSLVLDLSPLCHLIRNAIVNFYAFPAWLLYGPFGFHAFDRLTSLELRFVGVQDEVIQYIFGNCHMLQRLSLEGIPYMENFQLDNSLPELKHLEISLCLDLVNVYVSARSLTSFKYKSDIVNRTNMVFGDVPELSVLVLGGSYYTVVLDNLPFNLSQLNSVSLNHDAPVCLSQKVCPITLSTRSKEFNQAFVNPEGAPCGGSTLCFSTLRRFQELKQVELNIKGCLGDSILSSGTFLHTATCLEKLVLTLTWRYPGRAQPRKMEHVCKGCKHKCLKELVYVGWLGLDAEVEIVELLIESARSTVERITINQCHSHNDKDAIKLQTSWEKDNAKARAMQLQQKLLASSKAKLVIH